jgi:iron complex transport system substrate-binding protein
MTLALKRREFLLAIGTLMWVSACQSNPTSSEQPKSSRRIVALEWLFVENLLALGIQPVGVADIRGYQQYVNIPLSLAETVQDVGTRQEPNLEAIAQLQPDLILGVNFRHQTILSALESIAPTRLFQVYSDQVSQLTRLKQVFREMARLADHQAEGEKKLQRLETTLTEARETLSNQPISKRPIVLAAFVPDASPIRLFTNESLPIQLLSAIGLENAWKGRFSQFGFNRIGIESLTQLEDVSFIYVPPDENQQIEKEITTHPIWEKLPFVKNKQVYRLAGDTWLYGGIVSAELLVKQVRRQLVK